VTELPVAGYSPESPPAAADIAGVVADLADAITAPTSGDPSNVRVGVVTSVESVSPFRVKLDITGTAWLSRTADASLKVGDRAWAMQQGEVTIVAGRLNAIDAFTPIGTLLPFAGSSAPSGWLIADGSAVSRTTYAALFAVCGTTYGAGNGTTTFNVPNLTNRIPVGSGGSYSRGNTGGAASVALLWAEMPVHNHNLSSASVGSAGSHSHGGSTGFEGDHSHGVGNQSTRSDILAGGGTTTASNGGGSTGGGGGHSHSVSTDSQGGHGHSLAGSTDNAGSGNSHENMPPFVAMPYIIRAS
jgi:microcystin-dependent protein